MMFLLIQTCLLYFYSLNYSISRSFYWRKLCIQFLSCANNRQSTYLFSCSSLQEVFDIFSSCLIYSDQHSSTLLRPPPCIFSNTYQYLFIITQILIALLAHTLSYLLLLFFFTFPSMITQAQVHIDYQKVYQEIDYFIDTSHENFERTFNQRQNALIKQLQQRANQLKEQISVLKKLTSPQTIESMIIKRKQEKESERLKLEMHWRQLTQKLKKLEQEERKLQNQNKQAFFDIGNLETKISELANVNAKLEDRLKNIKLSIKHNKTISIPQKRSYVSPYKFMQIQKNPINTQMEQNSEQENIQKKLQSIKQIKKVPNEILIEFLNRRDIKSQIFQILRS